MKRHENLRAAKDDVKRPPAPLARSLSGWNNELGQIGGNFDNERSLAQPARINAVSATRVVPPAFLHPPSQQAMFDLWGSWLVSMSDGRTLPLQRSQRSPSEGHTRRGRRRKN